MTRDARGFTLIELMVTAVAAPIALIAVTNLWLEFREEVLRAETRATWEESSAAVFEALRTDRLHAETTQSDPTLAFTIDGQEVVWLLEDGELSRTENETSDVLSGDVVRFDVMLESGVLQVDLEHAAEFDGVVRRTVHSTAFGDAYVRGAQ